MLSLSSVVVVLLSAAFAIHKYLDFKKATAKVNNWPGIFDLFTSFSVIGFFVPAIEGIHIDRNHYHRAKHEDFARVGWNIITVNSLFPSQSLLSVADAEAIKEITSSRAKFPKPVEMYGVISFFGKNVVVTEGDEWKKHRRISGPAFSEKNNRLVWNATVSVVEELMDDIWLNKDEVVIDHFLHTTLRIALMVLSIAGYGRAMSWKADKTVPPGHRLPFSDALTTVSVSLRLRAVLPKWMLLLTKSTRKIHLAFDEVDKYLSEMIAERRLLLEKEERWDLLTNLIRGSDDDDTGESKLSSSELTGNIFIYLIAGHETTAHTLCYALGLLALYSDEQDKLYKHIKDVVGDRKPTYDDYTSLNRVLACVYEALRLYPIINSVPKRAEEDTVITTSSADPNSSATAKIVVPKGTNIDFHIPGLHFNPRYWKDPHLYNPDRFLGEWNKDAFVVFSSGARACIGRRFSESESVAALTTIITRYKVSIKEEPQFMSGSMEERREKIFASDLMLTLTPLRVPLVFTRRQ